MKTFVITGPEASGKSTLSTNLANGLNGHLIAEYARWYLPTLSRPYNFNDLLAICRGQEREMLKKRDGAPGKDFMFIDTWALVLMVWAEYRFGKSHLCFGALLDRYPVHHYFLCSPDIPWEEGPLRENPLDRNVLFEMYLKKLRHFDLPFTILFGNQNERTAHAKEIIESLS